jgi:hypothetical protein
MVWVGVGFEKINPTHSRSGWNGFLWVRLCVGMGYFSNVNQTQTKKCSNLYSNSRSRALSLISHSVSVGPFIEIVNSLDILKMTFY